MAQRSIKTKLQAENEQDHIQRTFNGMSIDLPASELPTGVSQRNVNCYDYGTYSEGRAGSRKYSVATRPEGTLQAVCSHEKSRLIIKIYGTKVYTCDKGMQAYREVFLMSGVSIVGPCTIVEYDQDALIFDSSGIYLLVLSDYFVYVRKMNEDLPSVLITDINQAGPNKWGHRYIYSLLQKSGNAIGPWNRLTESEPPIFESGSTKINSEGRDYGECYFAARLGVNGGGQVAGLTVPAGVYAVTHFGIYRSKNISQTSTPPGTGLNGIGNNPSMCVWIKDIPVARVFYGSQVGNTLVFTQGTVTDDDVGNDLYYADGTYAGYIMALETFAPYDTDEEFTVITVSENVDHAPSAVGFGGGRVFTGYQSGEVFKATYGTPFVPEDVGKPIFAYDGRVIWVREYISSTQVRTHFTQSIPNCAVTMAPITGNFSRKFYDTVPDDGTDVGVGVIGLQQRIESEQPIYWPRRFYSSLPGGSIGHVDTGFLFVAEMDDTVWRYADIGAKKYTCGYYRADHQKETVETHIKAIMTVGSSVIIILSNKTRSVPAQTATDVGNAANAESVFKIPSSTKISDIGVVLVGSIAPKADTIIAITNEPAVRIFNGTSWSTTNYAKDKVQKYIESIDPSERVVAVYTPGPYGGYKLWFKRWVLQ